MTDAALRQLDLSPALSVRAYRWWLAGIAVLALLVGISNDVLPRPLETHEVYVAQTAREMLARGEWVIPVFNGEQRLLKPPLAYWMVMGLEKLAASNPSVPEWKARLPEGLGGVALVVLSAMIARTLYSPWVGVVTGLLLCGTSGVFRYGNTARPEMIYAAACAVMLLGFVRARAEIGTTRSGAVWWALLGWGGAGLSILAKGPHVSGVMLLGLAIALWREGGWWHAWRVVRPWPGLLAMLAIALPWPMLVTLRVPHAMGVWFGQMSDEPARAQRSWSELLLPYYLWGVPLVMLPWAVLLPVGLAAPFVKQRDSVLRHSGRMLLWVLGAALAVLSVVTHRRWYYMLPLLCVLGPLTAAGTCDLVVRAGAQRVTKWAGAAIVVLAMGAVGAIAWLDRDVDFVRWTCTAGGMGLLVLLVLAIRGAGNARGVIPALLAVPVFFLACGGAPSLWGKSGYMRGEFAKSVASHVKAGDRLLLYGEQPGLITYELDRPTPEVASAAKLRESLETGAAWVVLPPSRLADLPSDRKVREVARLQEKDPGDSRVLVWVE